ncbi:hypothetical protein QCA50_004312 [Cerrena zonata]|uniref:Uncharacterized protein n=1 Tax=Cerrena zonata TaxID=2478898 RepID=A0AAW0GT37_9APHY
MSLARASRSVRLKGLCRPMITSRPASHHAGEHDHHHDTHSADSVAFPREDFSSPIWRRFVLAGLLAAGFYKFAPSPNEDNYFTRALAQYQTPSEYWAKLNGKHLALTAEAQTDSLLVASAKPPPVHRYRFPQAFEQYSPHVQAVGTSVDFSDLLVKGDKS